MSDVTAVPDVTSSLSDVPGPIYDAIVVGGGVGGAYAAYRLRTGALAGGTLPPDPADRKILLLEGSDRIGGRLESIAPPGASDLFAEFGGMGYTTGHTNVCGLVDHFGLAWQPFPTSGPDNLMYLRATRFTTSQATDPAVVPYRLQGNEVGKSPGGLMVQVITDVFGADAPTWSKEKWDDVLSTFVFHRRNLRDMGWWNFLSMNMSEEAFAYAQQGMGHFFQVANWNCAEAIPWFFGDGTAAYRTLTRGYDQLPISLANGFVQAGGELRMSTSMTGAEWLGSGFLVGTADGQTLATRRLILAMPRRALELVAPLTPVLDQPHVRSMISTVTGQPVMKIFLAYDRPWWQSLKIAAGSSSTDLPISNVWYFGPESGTNGNSLLMASYNDTLATSYWEGLTGGARYPDQPNRHVPSYDPNSTWGRQACSDLMVEEVQRQLALLHGVTPPAAYTSSYRDWSLDPYGGAFYTWNVGVDAKGVMDLMIQPDPNVALYTCGSAYSRDQGWAEGALDTAEMLVGGPLGLAPPPWLQT